jgi:hypothetical protein
MSRFFAAAFLIALLSPLVHASPTFVSYAFGKQYAVTISREALENSPAWKDDVDNPPLSARKAIKLAEELKNALVKDSKEYKWKLVSAELHPGDKWFWLINYEAKFQLGDSSGIPNNLRLVVLMDGTVIKPEVANWP